MSRDARRGRGRRRPAARAVSRRPRWTRRSSPGTSCSACRHGRTRGCRYYFSAVPFNWSDNDWSAVYATLAACPVPARLSVGVLPMQVPPAVRPDAARPDHLLRAARPGGRAGGRPLLRPPEARARRVRGGRRAGLPRLLPAADARRRSRMRIQVTAAGQLPPGVVGDPGGRHLADRGRPRQLPGRDQRAVSAYEVRRPGHRRRAAAGRVQPRRRRLRPAPRPDRDLGPPGPAGPPARDAQRARRRARRQLRVPASRRGRRHRARVPGAARPVRATPRRSRRRGPVITARPGLRHRTRPITLPLRSPDQARADRRAAPAAARPRRRWRSCASSGSTTASRSWSSSR